MGAQHGNNRQAAPRKPQRFRDLDAQRSPVPVIAIIGFLIGFLTMLASAVALTHAIRPAILPQIPIGASLCGPLAAAAGVAFVLSCVARGISSHKRHMGIRVRGGKRAVSGIVTSILALVMCAAGFGINHLFPEGVIKNIADDSAPVSDTARLRADLEAAAGACQSGWTDADVSQFPGVKVASYCQSNLTGYALFSNGTAADLYRSAIENQAKSTLGQYAGGTEPGSGWGALHGKEWIVIAGNDELAKLQQTWGGTLDGLK